MKYLVYAALILGAGVGSAGAASGSQPDSLCHDASLTHQEQDLCIEQIKHAQTMAEQKAVQAKFRKRITERQAAAKK